MLTAGYHNFDRISDPARATAAVIAGILGDTAHSAARRQHADDAVQIEQLIRAGALIDAALALIALELPEWQLRRVIYDGGEWHCALSRTRELSDWLDQSAEGRHTDLALALLDAFLEARRLATSSRQPTASSQPDDAMCQLLCCDNFS